MKYELAKKLKDVGLRVEHGEYEFCDWNGCMFWEEAGGTVLDESVHSPTLPELIEACIEKNKPGVDTFFLYEATEDPGGNGVQSVWHAGFRREKVTVSATGSEKEEAVANLYLTLHPHE